jgi:hypothetical protein
MQVTMSSRFRKQPEPPPTSGEQRLQELVDHEVEERAAELQRTLAIARAESVSLLGQEERRLAEQRRREFSEREQRASAELAMRLVEAQKRVEERLVGWTSDLERVQHKMTDEIARLEQQQRQVMAKVEAKITADSERLLSESQQQHTLLSRLRSDLEKAAKDALETATSELELHANERRRALHEVSDRLRKRERELAEMIERDQTEAARNIETAFADIERRQIEGLERTVRRESTRLAEAAAVQFDATIKTAREDAARRLARELDRAVSNFAREGERVLNDQLAELGESGIQRLLRTWGPADRRTSVRTNFPEEGSSESERTGGQ